MLPAPASPAQGYRKIWHLATLAQAYSARRRPPTTGVLETGPHASACWRARPAALARPPRTRAQVTCGGVAARACAMRASAICDAAARRQTSSYRRASGLRGGSAAASSAGSRAGRVGRTASCASCAFFALLLRRGRSTLRLGCPFLCADMHALYKQTQPAGILSSSTFACSKLIMRTPHCHHKLSKHT